MKKIVLLVLVFPFIFFSFCICASTETTYFYDVKAGWLIELFIGKGGKITWIETPSQISITGNIGNREAKGMASQGQGWLVIMDGGEVIKIDLRGIWETISFLKSHFLSELSEIKMSIGSESFCLKIKGKENINFGGKIIPVYIIELDKIEPGPDKLLVKKILEIWWQQEEERAVKLTLPFLWGTKVEFVLSP